MLAVRMVAGHELRVHWRRFVVLALLVGLAGAVMLAAAAGARRTATVFDRFQRFTSSADLELDSAPATPAQLRRLRAVPGVAAVAPLAAYGLVIPDAPDFEAIGAPTGPEFGTKVDRSRYVSGHAADPGSTDEVTIGEGLADELGVGVGGRIRARSWSPAQVDAILGGAADPGLLAGPTVRLRVVGIVRRPLDLGDEGTSGGLMVLTPAFDRAYAGRIGVFGDRLRVRTVRGATEVPRVLASARAILGSSLFGARALAVETRGATDAIDLAAAALGIVAGVALAAGAVAIGVVVSREVSLSVAEDTTRQALGFTRRERALIATIPVAAAGAVGAAFAVLGAIAASSWFPLGIARRADPDVGTHFDALVMLVGGGAVLLVPLLIAGAQAYRVTGGARRGPGPPGGYAV